MLDQSNLPYFAILLSILFVKFQEYSKRNIFTTWIVFLIGTIFHELAHFFVSLITFGKPTWFSILPSKSVDAAGNIGYTLGYVKSENVRWFNVFFISMAPLLLLPLSFFVYQYFFTYFQPNLPNFILYIFLLVSLIVSSIPSKIDFLRVIQIKFPLNLILPILIAIFLYK